MLARVIEIRFTFPRRPQKTFLLYFVDNGDDPAPAVYGPVAGHLVDLKTLNAQGNVVGVYVEGEGFRGVAVENALR